MVSSCVVSSRRSFFVCGLVLYLSMARRCWCSFLSWRSVLSVVWMVASVWPT